MKKISFFILLFMILLSACASAPAGEGISTPLFMTAEVSTVIADNGGSVQPLPTSGPPTAMPTLPGGLSITELKYRVLEEFPDFFFCDPDLYPIARADEATLALQAFPDLQSNQEEFQAILAHNNLSGQTALTDEQKLLIYREHKKLNAIVFQPADGRYQFQIQTGSEGQQGTVITGTIDGSGSLDVLKREPGNPQCPICLAKGTLIDTPRGAVRVEDLGVGDSVWTQDESGRRASAFIVRTGHMSVPAAHQMVHIALTDGRELWASPAHPSSDGRRLGDLKIGDRLDGALIASLEHVPYGQSYTFDILPAGATGFYWANGILVGSTLSGH